MEDFFLGGSVVVVVVVVVVVGWVGEKTLNKQASNQPTNQPNTQTSETTNTQPDKQPHLHQRVERLEALHGGRGHVLRLLARRLIKAHRHLGRDWWWWW